MMKRFFSTFTFFSLILLFISFILIYADEQHTQITEDSETLKHNYGSEPESTKSDVSTFITESESDDSIGKGKGTSPSLAWFFAFPQSGGTHFMYLFQNYTQLSTAVNFGHVVMNEKGIVQMSQTDSVRVFNNTSGPSKFSTHLPLPNNYVLTRTHGSFFCLKCHPKLYVNNYENFVVGCSSGTAILESDIININYEINKVKKAIHLIQDPFDNVVARFLSDRGRQKKRKRYYWLELFSDDFEGFQKWCAFQDHNYYKIDKRTYPEDIFEAMRDIPCRQEFFKYANWHNYVYKLSGEITPENENQVIVHYEDFKRNLTGTLALMADYLNMPYHADFVKEDPLFESNDHYFTETQIGLVKDFLKNFSSEKVWNELEIYFETQDSIKYNT